MLELTHKLKRIQLQNDIMFSKKMENVSFPRQEKKITKITVFETLPSDIEIISEINRAREDAIICLDKHNVCFGINDLDCPIKLTNRISNPIEEEDSEDYSDSDEEKSDDDDDKVEDGTSNGKANTEVGFDEIYEDADHLQVDLGMLTTVTGEVQLKNYSTNLTTPNSIPETSPFASVTTLSGKNIVVRKSSIVWLLSQKTPNLSSDRLVRVQDNEYAIKKSKF